MRVRGLLFIKTGVMRRIGDRAVPVELPFDGVPRVDLQHYVQEACALYVALHSKTLLGFTELLKFIGSELLGARTIMQQESDTVCCMVSLRTQAISVYHRAIMHIYADSLGFSVREVRAGDSRNGRCFDLCGTRTTLLVVLPLYMLTLRCYDLMIRRRLRKVQGSRQDKFHSRGVLNSFFFSELRQVLRQALTTQV